MNNIRAFEHKQGDNPYNYYKSYLSIYGQWQLQIKELNEDTPEELTRAERDNRSRIIFHINIIQNELTRTINTSILANLQTKTDELAGITKGLEKDINHLQQVTAKLNKATQSIAKLANVLAYGLSQGWTKPLTPKGASVAAVKDGIN